MASSSSSPSTPAFCSQVWKYHVFLSFRGEDTRKTFVDHLYTALEQKGIHTYKDDETLPRGESIGPSLMTAIEESQIAIIIFSKNYADSSWCLDELVHIMKCKHTRGQIVMPVFYGIDPSEVRKQKSKYREAFRKHKLESKDKVESWRKALVEASNISGWEPKYIANGYESKCIKEIVDTISHRLHPLTSSVDDNLVGVEARMQDLISKLQLGSSGKRMIGIWGVGGGGKTTLASSIYDEISRTFDGSCFIKIVRAEASNKNGLENLQAKIISSVLQQKQVQVGRVEEGRRMIRDRLYHRKVLIVLDDVDNLEHLEELVGSRDWFGGGSRIIITTRDEHVLTALNVDVIHNIHLLNKDEAMKLLCKHVLRGHRRIEEYKVLLKEVVSYAGGLPLALRVLGRFLCDKEMNEWRTALARLKEIPDANILEVLKISFDGLTTLEKELFLDIACFFRGKYNKEKMMIIDACGFHPVIGVKVLIQKALITISSNGMFDMHDLVEEMAHYIVRGKHPNNPAKHSRVWKRQDVLNICTMDATTNLDKIEAITAQCYRSDEPQRVLEVAANMKKLQRMDLNVFLLGNYSESAILPLLPENFPPRELCCLTLNGLHAKQFWEGYKYLPNLRMIKLEQVKRLTKTPNFEGLPNLERFVVANCMSLEEIHPSFGRLEKLVCVRIDWCDRLKMLPPITRSKNLETFEISRCESVFNSSKFHQNMENIVPHNMKNIRHWFFSGCLRKLDLSNCKLADGDITSGAVWVLPNLEVLDLSRNRFVHLNFSLLQLPQLKWLDVSVCTKLVELMELPSSIAVVIAYDCRSLESFGDISNCKCLWKVSLWGGNKVGPLFGDILLNSMRKIIAKYYFISITISYNDIWRGFVVWLDWVKTCNMLLPHNWYNDFSGILMFVKSDIWYVHADIIIKKRVNEDLFNFELSKESNETLGAHYHTHVGYVSFSSLRHTGCLNSTYNMLSFSCDELKSNVYVHKYSFGVVLVPKDGPMQATKVARDSSELWDVEGDSGKTFAIQHDSNSSIKIRWVPLAH